MSRRRGFVGESIVAVGSAFRGQRSALLGVLREGPTRYSVLLGDPADSHFRSVAASPSLAADISSDVHFWKEGAIGNTRLTAEVGAGHESAGEIVALGPGVEGWAVGDRVAIEAGIPCGRAECEQCRRGSYNQCKWAASR